MKYAFIKRNECNVPATRQCKWLGVSTSGYYDWQARQSRPPKRSGQQSVIDEAVAIAFKDRHGRYGSPRLTLSLNEAGFHHCREHGSSQHAPSRSCSEGGAQFKATTNSTHDLPVVPNLLGQDSSAAPSTKRQAEITCLWTDEG